MTKGSIIVTALAIFSCAQGLTTEDQSAIAQIDALKDPGTDSPIPNVPDSPIPIKIESPASTPDTVEYPLIDGGLLYRYEVKGIKRITQFNVTGQYISPVALELLAIFLPPGQPDISSKLKEFCVKCLKLVPYGPSTRENFPETAYSIILWFIRKGADCPVGSYDWPDGRRCYLTSRISGNDHVFLSSRNSEIMENLLIAITEANKLFQSLVVGTDKNDWLTRRIIKENLIDTEPIKEAVAHLYVVPIEKLREDGIIDPVLWERMLETVLRLLLAAKPDCTLRESQDFVSNRFQRLSLNQLDQYGWIPDLIRTVFESVRTASIEQLMEGQFLKRDTGMNILECIRLTPLKTVISADAIQPPLMNLIMKTTGKRRQRIPPLTILEKLVLSEGVRQLQAGESKLAQKPPSANIP
ncbi:MAG: hypothetical protein LBF65_03780 [Holosporales bacterium]|jgi:hypothetical protein|nr:hypothetical protein [Holosporales bacterium]